MRKTTVNLRTGRDRWVRTTGYLVDATGGELVVHRTMVGDGWDVTHRRSGMRVSDRPYRCRLDAIEAAEQAAGVPWGTVDDMGRGVDRWSDEDRRLAAAAFDRYVPPPGDGDDGYVPELPDGWSWYDVPEPDGDLECPCGYRIEPDGVCPNGCVAPQLV